MKDHPLPQLLLAYVRVSTDRQDLSVDAQTETIRRAADYHCSTGTLELFAEPDTSGAMPFLERPQGQRLIQRAREAVAAGAAVTVIVPKIDRLGRDVVDVNQTV